MYPLDLSVAAGARRAQFLSWAFPTGTQIPKPPAYDCAYTKTAGLRLCVHGVRTIVTARFFDLCFR